MRNDGIDYREGLRSKRQRPVRRRLLVEQLEKRDLLTAVVRINEFLASNSGGLNDGYGNSSDWIELVNSGTSAQNLAGWYLTDDSTQPTKWMFPSVAASIIDPGEHLVVFASGTSVPDPAGNLHTNFALSANGEYLALFRPDLSLVSEFNTGGNNFPPQFTNVSYGISQSINYVDADEAPGGNTSGLMGDWIVRGAGGGEVGTTTNWGNNGGVLQASGSANVSQLATTTSGLDPTKSYEAYVFFWDITSTGSSNDWNIQAGLTSNSLTNFTSTSPGVFRIDGITQAATSNLRVTGLNVLPNFNNWLNGTDRALYAVSLGTVSNTSSLTVFVDHLTNSPSRTWYDGIGFRPTTPDVRFFSPPTPGAPNGASFLGVVEDAIFSQQRGHFSAPFNLSLSTPTAGASIYYTTNGSEPVPNTAGTFLYTSPININKTTNVRAAAFRTGFKTSNVTTQSYIFTADVVRQDPLNSNGLGATPTNGLTYAAVWQGGFAGDYAIDDRANPSSLTYNAAVFGSLQQSFLNLPTISLTMNHDNVFGPNGINTDATIEQLRYGGSMEFFDPATGDSFQHNVGIQAHGSASRDNNRLLKHSFRLIFSDEFNGPTRLNYPLFDNSNFSDINTVVLKASFTDSFATRTITDRYNPIQATYLRDVLMRDTQLAMGGYASDSTLAHLFINGLYWGVYIPQERVDDAYLSSRFGGAPEDWDILRDFNELYAGVRTSYDQMVALTQSIKNTTDATTANNLYQQLQGKNPNGTINPSLPPLLDVDNFIDYMILHLYAGAEDWPSHNWVAGRNRLNPDKGFRFFTWDQENALDQLYRNKFTANNASTPGEIFQNLRNSSEFRLRFADRIQKHMYNDGALTTAKMQERWTRRVNQLAPAIVAESARWGDAREGQSVIAYSSVGGQIPAGTVTVPLMTPALWRVSTNYVNNTIFANSHPTMISRSVSTGLYSTLAAPVMQINGTNQHGGATAPGSNLGFTGTGTIFYTLNGTDPRSATGTAVGTQFTSPVTLQTTTSVKARIRSATGQWSPLVEATFVVPASSLVISEINYNPYAPTTSELAVNPLFVADDFEFVEILNTSSTETVQMLDVKLADGITFTFGSLSLAPGQRTVVARNQSAFQARYGTGIATAGVFTGSLSNSGENIQLMNPLNNEIMSVFYNDVDPWYPATDGSGPTLQLQNPLVTSGELTKKYYSWKHSVERGGSPGTAGIAPRGIVINEIRSHTDAPLRDAVELFNTTAAPIDISGWFLSDSANNLFKYQIPNGTVLGAGQYIVFDESHFNPTPSTPAPNHFAFNAAQGDDVYLTRSGSNGLTAIEDVVFFGATFNSDSIGRLPNGTGRFVRLNAPTFGASNETSTNRMGSLIISEVNYHPGAPSSAALAIDSTMLEGDLEFIEVHNPTNAPVNTQDWRIRGDVDFNFPVTAGAIPAGGTWVIVSFDPALAANVNKLAAFRAHYGITDPAIRIFGKTNRSMSDSFGRVSLQQPDTPPASAPTTIPRVIVDEMVFDDLVGFPSNADGFGPSLHRVSRTSNGNVSSSWRAMDPTPGRFATTAEGRFVFYNNSSFDGFSALLNASDDNALALNKRALLPGQASSTANYTNYSLGINGVFVDLAGAVNLANLSSSDFLIEVGDQSDNQPIFSPYTGAVSVSTRAGAGLIGSTRIALGFADSSIVNRWLKVTVLANANTGLAANDIFYFGHQFADVNGDVSSTNRVRVNSLDTVLVRLNQASSVDIQNAFDLNRDGRVSSLDTILVRLNQGSSLLMFTTDVVLPPAMQMAASSSSSSDFGTMSVGSLIGTSTQKEMSLSDYWKLLQSTQISTTSSSSSFARLAATANNAPSAGSTLSQVSTSATGNSRDQKVVSPRNVELRFQSPSLRSSVARLRAVDPVLIVAPAFEKDEAHVVAVGVHTVSTSQKSTPLNIQTETPSNSRSSSVSKSSVNSLKSSKSVDRTALKKLEAAEASAVDAVLSRLTFPTN